MKFWSPGLCAATVLLFLVGCASTPSEDPMDQWREISDSARAHTPDFRPIEPRFEIPEAATILDQKLEVVPDPPFPQQRVSLRMHDAPMTSLLSALARAAQVNMVLSPNARSLEGVSVSIEDVPWEVAFRALADAHGLIYAWRDGVLQVRTVADIRDDMEREQAALEFSRIRMQALNSGHFVTSVVKLRYLNIRSGEDTLAGIDLTEMVDQILNRENGGENRGVVVPHPETNSLIIRASRPDTEKVFALLEHLDRPRPQILIQAHIVETNQETARDLGFQWGGRRVGFTDGQPWMVAPGVGAPAGNWPASLGDPVFDLGQGSGGMASNFPADLTNTLTGLTLGVVAGGANYLEVQLTALQRDGKLNILSSPSITTMNNQMAFTENGERVPYVTIDEDGNRSVEFEDAVLRLEITPHVVDEDHLRMDIKVKNDQVDLLRNVDGNPFIIKKETQTSLVVGNEQTVVISGLTKELTSRRMDGVPWLKDLPGLGALFRRDLSRQDMAEVLIFITPTILPPSVRPIAVSQDAGP